MNYDLSILIPSRNEMFLARTVQDIFEHAEGKTQVIVGLDGQWANPPLQDNPNLTIVYYPESIGQRSLTNQLCRLSSAKYVMKVDAHCSFDQGFDVKMIEMFEKEGDDITAVPIMKNMHVFDWVCSEGHRRYQGPSGPCQESGCGKPTTRDIVWIAKQSPQSKSYCFDSEPHFRYFGDWCKRGPYKKDLAEKGYTETMSLQGSCFMSTRKKYWELGLCSEDFPSWGSQGIQVACLTWLSGGRVLVNHKTFYGHLFRTAGGDFGFPYAQSGKNVDKAKKYAKELFYGNKFPRQILPSSWLLDKFWPVLGWDDIARAEITKAGIMFSNLRSKELGVLGVVPLIPESVTNHAAPVTTNKGGQEVPIPAVGLSGLPGGSPVSSENILGIGDESKMGGITTDPIVANVIQNGDITSLTSRDGTNQPCVHETVDSVTNFVDANITIPIVGETPNPIPTPSGVIDTNLFKDTTHCLGTDVVNNKLVGDVHNTSISQPVPKSKGMIFYTDNILPEHVANAVQDQLRKISAEKNIPIVSASLKPLDNMGTNIHVDLPWGRLSMWKQILAALEASTSEYIFFAEHDVLYSPSHFEFTPPRKDTYYYNHNIWKVRLEDDLAIHYHACILSGMCCDRELAIKEFKKRVEVLTAEGKWRSSMGYEPGTRGIRRGGFFDNPWKSWESEVPLVDIKHGHNLTTQRWKKEEYRDQENCTNWEESTADKVPGWTNLIELLKIQQKHE